MNIAAKAFGQGVGSKNLALLVKHQRREAESSERFAGEARSLQLQTGRQEHAAGEMGAELIELLDERTFYRSTFGQSRHDEKHILARCHRNGRAHTPTDAL